MMLLILIIIGACSVNNEDNKNGDGKKTDQHNYLFKRGISRTHLYRAGGIKAQKAMLRSMKDVGVETIRLGISSNTHRDVIREQILYANKIGLKVTLLLGLGSRLKVLYPPKVKKATRSR